LWARGFHLLGASPAFEIPQEIYTAWSAKEQGAKLEAEWNELFAQYQARYPAEAAEFVRRMEHRLPENFDAYIQTACALHKLLMPHEMGELFKVIAFGRNIGIDWQGFAHGDICHKL